MATLAKQTIPDDVKEKLEILSDVTGNSIASIVRGILKESLDKTVICSLKS